MQLERTAIRHGGHGGYCVGAVGEHAAAEKEVAGRGRVGFVLIAALLGLDAVLFIRGHVGLLAGVEVQLAHLDPIGPHRG